MLSLPSPDNQPADPLSPQGEAPAAPPPPREGERTGQQATLLGVAGVPGLGGPEMIGGPTLCGWGGGPSYGMGGSSDNPCGFPGWGGLYRGVYWVYDFMLQHPVIRHARATVMAPVIGSRWSYEASGKSVPDEVVTLVRKVFDRLRPGVVPAALRGLDNGWAPFEVVWGRQQIDLAADVDESPPPPPPPPPADPAGQLPGTVPPPDAGADDGEGEDGGGSVPPAAAAAPPPELDQEWWVIRRLKPLDPARTQIYTDRHGNLTRLLNNPSGVTATDAGPNPTGDSKPDQTPPVESRLEARPEAPECWVYTHDARYGNLYGRSRLENLRQTCWPAWLSCQQQMEALGAKISGRQAYALAPVGDYEVPGTGGRRRTFTQDAADALTAFAQGKNPVMACVGMDFLDPELTDKYAGKTPTSFNVIDFGNDGPALTGLLARQEKAEAQMFMGYLRSPRTGMEASTAGSRADAAEHTDSGTMESQYIADDQAQQLQPLVDALVFQNFGLPPGSVLISNSPLVDTQQAAIAHAFDGLLFNDMFKAELVNVLDVDWMIDQLKWKRKKNFDETLFDPRVLQAQQQAQQQATLAQQHAETAATAAGAAAPDDDAKGKEAA